MHVRFVFRFLSYVLIELSLARTKPTTQASPAQSSETLLAPPSDASESQADRIDDEKADGVPSEDGEEASSGGAFDPVTGKINWDCPCLGGMAYGPCGMQFREAFSCFVFSEEEPKGIDCVEKFKAMQDCFRENPDVYGEGTLLCPASLFLHNKQPFCLKQKSWAMMMTRMGSYLLKYHHLILGTLFQLHLPSTLHNHLQNRSLQNLPSLSTLDARLWYLYYSPLTSSRKIRVPTP